jgi:RNA polymerase sigma-70 factor, ECF subfamily
MSLDVDDVDVIRLFRAGRRDAFTQVVAEHRAALLRHALRRLHDTAAAEDVVQETFFRAYRSFDRLDEDSRIGPWLHQICANVCIDEANRRNREADKSMRACTDPSTTRGVSPAVDEQLGFDVDTGPAERAILSLPDTHRAAFTLRFVDELEYHEIAAVEGTSEENVRARVSRARSSLRTALRGAVAVPAFFVALTRRGARNAGALERTESAHRVTAAAETSLHASKLATHLAPAIETANAVVVSGQHTAPLITKAALGIGAIGLAVMTSASENLPPAPPPEAVPPPAALTIDDDPTELPAAPVTVAAVPETTAAVSNVPAPVTRVAAAAPIGVAADSGLATSTVTAEPAPATTVVASTAPPTTAPPTTAAAAEPVVAVIPEPAPEPDTDPGTAVPVETPVPVDESEPAIIDEPAPTTVAPPVLLGGSLSVGELSVTPAGPRLDVAGQVSLTVGATTWSGTLSGRLSVADELDADGRQRLDGVLTLQFDGATIEVRVAGHAVGLDATDDQPATSFSLSGQFRATGGEALSLVGSGSFGGALGPGSLSLQLAL